MRCLPFFATIPLPKEVAHLKTMLDFVKDALPEGAVIDSPKELASCYRFHFSYSGHSIKWEVPKTVAPGYEKKTAERTVATCMTQIFMETGEVEQARKWLEAAMS